MRAASFATSNPLGSGVSATNEILATITLQALGLGVSDIFLVLNVGDDEVSVAQVDVTSSVILGPGFTVTVVPEPSTAVLMGLGFIGLATARRRSV